jgi:predicted aldo/keto reductase-like oxidoreductase
MNTKQLSRRQFLGTSAALAGAALFSPLNLFSAEKPKRTAVDQVALGKTGLQCSRLGFGAGSNSGNVQRALGQETFNRLIRYAYDQGITYIDCAQSYRTFDWIGAAIKGLPREKLFLQSKIGGTPQDVLAAIDRHRKVYDTDYIDSMLVHCMVKDGWTDAMKRVLDGFNEAKEKKWIRAKGVSCHSLPALQAATASDWTEIHLVRVNPQGAHIDTPVQTVNAKSDETHLNPVMKEIKTMHDKGRGVIGMKLIGNGDFKNPEDREKSIRFVMAQPEIDCVVIGFKSTDEIDEAIQRMNRALAAG